MVNGKLNEEDLRAGRNCKPVQWVSGGEEKEKERKIALQTTRNQFLSYLALRGCNE
jgi:hypothetical protein